MTLEELDLAAWVEKSAPDKRHFREAVHIVLSAIGASTALRSKMIMKGGLLMAIRYDSSRFTRDVDFSTQQKYIQGAEEDLLVEFDEQLAISGEQLPYDTMCRRQRTEIRPARPDAQFPTLSLSIGYAQRSKAVERTRLLNGQAPQVVQIDYSYNEAVYDVEVLGIGNGEKLQAYSFLNLLAEKIRSLLQQPLRKRNRRQDVYDLHLLITGCASINKGEQIRLLQLFRASCRERRIEPTQNSLSSDEIKVMAKAGYEDLAPEIEGELPPFDETYAIVQEFYESLPWEEIE
jgi:predicted nucleotidyltransferase component of viral defense system